jgi:bifunctional non-homologous end joining protein LigD
VDAPFHRPGWVYEEKYDGYRILAYKEGKRVTLCSRNAKDRTATFAEIAKAVAALRPRSVLVDGEVVGFDQQLVSRFQLLQQGGTELAYMVFDCLWLGGRDLRNEPLRERRKAVEAAVRGARCIFPARRLAGDGYQAFAEAKQRGFEGLVGKEEAAPYVEGRSPRWLKVKSKQEDEFVIGGYTAPGGTRTHFGALLLGAYDRGTLRYVGKVGTGFTHARLAELHRQFQRHVRDAPPFVDPPRERGAVWLEPVLVAQIAYQEWTEDRKLRQPVFLGLRDDKPARQVRMPTAR